MAYVHEFTVTLNKATCKVMPLALGYNCRIHGLDISLNNAVWKLLYSFDT
mgnify:CR=1 FL=1